jgi:Ser/Thr protein kinase RdoA (MazF antagonist)
MRPSSRRAARNSALWPRYTQQLYGAVPNGDISTLIAVTEDLVRHGSIRTPKILRVDISGDHVAAPYLISELLPGRPLGWDDERPPATAAQLGDHVGRIHLATSGPGFGIYAQRHYFELADWWPHFARSYRTLAGELAGSSPPVAEAAPLLERALARGIKSGSPATSALICLDQSPTHYLGPGDGTISAMVDVEGHLFAPTEYELALLEVWIADRATLAQAYERHRHHPAALLEEVRPAYWLFTWMEWAYTLRTLIHDQTSALELEQRLAHLAGQIA